MYFFSQPRDKGRLLSLPRLDQVSLIPRWPPRSDAPAELPCLSEYKLGAVVAGWNIKCGFWTSDPYNDCSTACP